MQRAQIIIMGVIIPCVHMSVSFSWYFGSQQNKMIFRLKRDMYCTVTTDQNQQLWCITSRLLHKMV